MYKITRVMNGIHANNQIFCDQLLTFQFSTITNNYIFVYNFDILAGTMHRMMFVTKINSWILYKIITSVTKFIKSNVHLLGLQN